MTNTLLIMLIILILALISPTVASLIRFLVVCIGLMALVILSLLLTACVLPFIFIREWIADITS